MSEPMSGSPSAPTLGPAAQSLVSEHLPELLVDEPLDASWGGPLEWIVDVADEQGAWFIGTAYRFDGPSKSVFVCIPDNLEPTWQGHVPLYPRSIKLLECGDEDERSRQLFHAQLKASIMEVDWQVEFAAPGGGGWVRGSARLYVRLGGYFLVQHTDGGEVVRLSIGDDMRFIKCGVLGAEEYEWLVQEGLVEARDTDAGTQDDDLADQDDEEDRKREEMLLNDEGLWAQLPASAWPTKALHLTPQGQVSSLHGLIRDTDLLLEDALSAHECARAEASSSLKSFQSFVQSGDLLQGLTLVDAPHLPNVEEQRELAELSVVAFQRALVTMLQAHPDTADLCRTIRRHAQAEHDAMLPNTRDQKAEEEELLRERAALRRDLRAAKEEQEELEARLQTLEARRRRLEQR